MKNSSQSPSDVLTPHPGLFIAFEGADGAGKTTQAQLLRHTLNERGYEVLLTREPGGSSLGEHLRSLVLADEGSMDSRTETLLFAAARASHVAQTIIPALRQGTIVVTDRYLDSSLAYQGGGREMAQEEILHINRWATDGILPATTIVLDVSTQNSQRRLPDRQDRFEKESEAFRERVRQTFLDIAHANPTTHYVLDAQMPPQELHRRVLDHLSTLLPVPR